MREKLEAIEAALVAARMALDTASDAVPMFDWSGPVGQAYDAVDEALDLVDEAMEEYDATHH